MPISYDARHLTYLRILKIKLQKEMAERLTSHERLAMTIARLEKRNKTLVSRQTAQVCVKEARQ